MLFSSTIFLYLFLPAVLFCYYILLKKSRKLQNIFLLFASLFFYAWGEPKFVLVMIASIIANWAFGLLIHKNKGNKIVEKIIISLDVAFNLGILFVFKFKVSKLVKLYLVPSILTPLKSFLNLLIIICFFLLLLY